VNGLVTKIETGTNRQGPYTLTYSDYSSGEATGESKSLEVDLIVGADGANSRVAKAMDAGDYNVAIAFQERIRLPVEEMKYYEDLAEMYVGTDVSPDFYAWVFPKYDHVAVGTGTMQQNQGLIKSLQVGIRERAKKRLVNGEVIKVEAHPIPEHPRPRRVVGRMALVGDAAGYVTKSSGEGIYFAAKSGRMCAEQIVESSSSGSRIPTEQDLKKYLKKWDRKYGATYKVLEILQNIFYRNDAAREAFVEMCDDKDVQRLTFDSYLYKRVVMMNPWQQLKLTLLTLGSVLRGNALAPQGYKPVCSAVREDAEVNAMLAVSSIKGGIKVAGKGPRPEPGKADQEREPVLAAK
jgi:geranylgeranyl diphosphate/geranylgeranyl-bacteriochlorophyllide a reductase